MITQLHEVLVLERPLIGVDLETTGKDPRRSGICQIALEIFRPGEPVKEWKTLVNPLMNIPDSATKVHGITNAMVQGAPTFVQLADNLLMGMSNCDFAGYNIRFDLRQLAEEFQRAAKPWTYHGARILDGFRLWQLAEGRTLSHAVERWLKSSKTVNEQEIYDELDREGQAHDALWDIRMSTRVIAAQLRSCAHLPRNLDQLHELCWPGWFDPEGKLRWQEGELVFGFGEHKEKPVRHIVATKPNYITGFILRKDFSELVKQTCRNALKGIYPAAPMPSAEEIDADD